jgi:hypothetical protein
VLVLDSPSPMHTVTKSGPFRRFPPVSELAVALQYDKRGSIPNPLKMRGLMTASPALQPRSQDFNRRYNWALRQLVLRELRSLCPNGHKLTIPGGGGVGRCNAEEDTHAYWKETPSARTARLALVVKVLSRAPALPSSPEFSCHSADRLGHTCPEGNGVVIARRSLPLSW